MIDNENQRMYIDFIMTKKAADTSLSIRLTADERRLIEEAAGKKGWKAANFLRVSALDRAAHVLNLSRPTSFDFSGAARHLAEVLLRPRDVSLYSHGAEAILSNKKTGRFGAGEGFIGECCADDSQRELTLDDVELCIFEPAALTGEEVDKLHEAIRLGGTEFAEQLVVECRRLVGSAGDANLPAPIDPQKLKN